MSVPKLDAELCRRIAARARENCSLVRQVLGLGGEELAAQMEAAVGEASRMRDLALVAIEGGVDMVLGEVSRQLSGISPNIGTEARGVGLRHGRSLLGVEPADPLPGAGNVGEGLSDSLSEQMIRKFGAYYDLCDADLEYLLHNVASTSGFLRPLIREILRRRSESAAPGVSLK